MKNLRSAAYFAEDNTLSDREQVINLYEDIVFRFLVLAVHIELFDALH